MMIFGLALNEHSVIICHTNRATQSLCTDEHAMIKVYFSLASILEVDLKTL